MLAVARSGRIPGGRHVSSLDTLHARLLRDRLLRVAGPVGAASADAVHPVRITRDQVAGKIFEDYEPVVKTEDGNTTHDVEVFLSKEKQFDAGMYRSGKVRGEIRTPYGVNEYMHFLEGGVTLTSSDVHGHRDRRRDSVVIPAEWTGVWDTEGYTKIYVIYSPDKPIE